MRTFGEQSSSAATHAEKSWGANTYMLADFRELWQTFFEKKTIRDFLELSSRSVCNLYCLE